MFLSQLQMLQVIGARTEGTRDKQPWKEKKAGTARQEGGQKVVQAEGQNRETGSRDIVGKWSVGGWYLSFPTNHHGPPACHVRSVVQLKCFKEKYSCGVLNSFQTQYPALVRQLPGKFLESILK